MSPPCHCRGQLGALRLAVRLLEDTVLPPQHYQPLIQLLTEPILCPAQVGAGAAGNSGVTTPVWRPRCAHPALPTAP